MTTATAPYRAHARAVQYIGDLSDELRTLARRTDDQSCKRGAAVTNANRTRRAPLLAQAGLVEMVTPDQVRQNRERMFAESDRDRVERVIRLRRSVTAYLRELRLIGVPGRILRNHVRYWRRVLPGRDLVYLMDTLFQLHWQAAGFRATRAWYESLGNSWVQNNLPDKDRSELRLDWALMSIRH